MTNSVPHKLKQGRLRVDFPFNLLQQLEGYNHLVLKRIENIHTLKKKNQTHFLTLCCYHASMCEIPFRSVDDEKCGSILPREVLRWASKMIPPTVKHFSVVCGLRIKEDLHFVILKPPHSPPSTSA